MRLAARVQVLKCGPQLLGALALLHGGGFALGYGASKLLRLPETVARTNSIEVGGWVGGGGCVGGGVREILLQLRRL